MNILDFTLREPEPVYVVNPCCLDLIYEDEDTGEWIHETTHRMDPCWLERQDIPEAEGIRS